MDDDRILEIMTTVARELAEAIERRDVPRTMREKSRGLLLEAWKVESANTDTGCDHGRVHRLIKEMDNALCSFASTNDLSERMNMRATGNLFVLSRMNPAVEDGIVPRIESMGEFVSNLLRKTETMIKMAEDSAVIHGDRGNRGNSPSQFDHEGRQYLELVWGETED